MNKNNDFDEFIKMLEEAVENLKDDIQDISDRPVFIDISINAYRGHAGSVRRMPVDILETEKNIHALIGLPGLKKEDIELSCNGWALEVTADSLKETIELPARVNKTGMKAEYRNGVLEVIFNKSKKTFKKSNA